MERKQMYSAIEKNYQSGEKGKNFITHLLRSFFPPDKVNFVFEKPSNVTEMYCCISGKKLISKIEVLAAHNAIGPEVFVKHLQESFKASTEGSPSPENPMKEKLAGRTLAIGCEKSTKFLCQEAWEELANFMTTEVLKGNKHLNWVISSERTKNAPPKPMNNNNKKEDEYVPEKPKKLTFGDLGVLQGLKNKLESEEKIK